MRAQRVLVWLLIAAGVMTPVAACADGSKAGGSASSREGSAIDELRSAFRSLDTVSHRTSFFLEAAEVEVRGEVDRANGRYRLVSGYGPSAPQTIVVGKDMYVRLGTPTGGVPADKFMRVDPTRAPLLVGGLIDGAIGADTYATFADALVKVERDGFNRFTGTIDFTKLSMKASFRAQFPEGGRAVPFKAGTSTNNYPTTFEYDLPADGTTPAGPLKITYSDYGHKLDIRAPEPSETVDAPASVYDTYGG